MKESTEEKVGQSHPEAHTKNNNIIRPSPLPSIVCKFFHAQSVAWGLHSRRGLPTGPALQKKPQSGLPPTAKIEQSPSWKSATGVGN